MNHVYRTSLIFCEFSSNGKSLISPARGSDRVIHSKDYRRVEHVKAGLASSKFPTVIPHNVFFVLHFHILVQQFILFPFETPLFVVANFTWEDEASRYCDYNDRENDHRFLARHQCFSGILLVLIIVNAHFSTREVTVRANFCKMTSLSCFLEMHLPT